LVLEFYESTGRSFLSSSTEERIEVRSRRFNWLGAFALTLILSRRERKERHKHVILNREDGE
jgi:hypothetical protein